MKALESGDWNHRWTPAELVAISNRHRPNFAPGAGYSYCNTCFVLAGRIIEKVTGNALDDEMSRRIFVPLKLRSTSFDRAPTIKGPHIHGYELVGKPPLTDTSDISPTYGWSAGAIVSTSDDIARFYRALVTERLIRPAELAAMRTTIKAPGLESGLGIVELALPCGKVWGHDGGSPGYNAFAFTSASGSRQVVVFVNLGEDSQSSKAKAAISQLLTTAYCGSTGA